MMITETATEIDTTLIQVTERAIQHFQKLLAKEDTPGMNLRVHVESPGTALADVGVTFCPAGDEEPSDSKMLFPGFTLFVDKDSKEALQEATIDYEENNWGGQLAVKAPYLKGKEPAIGSSLEERVQYVLETEITPSLASHGGRVSLVEILEGGIVVLRFGGGCQGCGMVTVTLKHGIEKTLKEKFPEISEIRDLTDHKTGENPYY
jgi:Fe/S biogenesis protein NfuA